MATEYSDYKKSIIDFGYTAITEEDIDVSSRVIVDIAIFRADGSFMAFYKYSKKPSLNKGGYTVEFFKLNDSNRYVIIAVEE